MHYIMSMPFKNTSSIQKAKGYTYKEPKANINMAVNLFLKLRLRPINTGTGSKMITMSSTMLNPALVKITALELIHFPFTFKSQTASTGIHCKVAAIKNAKPSHTSHAKNILIRSRNCWSGKMRKKRRRIEALARVVMAT